MSANRTRTKARIKRLDTWSGREFENALSRVILSRREHLDFYTDDQLEEIAAQMVRDAWFAHCLNRENRKRAAVLADAKARAADASLQSLQTKEEVSNG